MTHRRSLLTAGLAGLAGTLALRPAQATPEALREAVRAFAGDAPLRNGRVQIDIAALVENGNTVPVTLRVQSPMSEADHVQRLALFTERNPDPGVVIFELSPHNGRAEVATRIRLATSQRLQAVALMSDGSAWQATVEVLVTLAACVEG